MSLPSTLAPLPTMPPMQPIVSPHVERALAVTFIVLYGLLFLFIYIQLFLILYYGHKRFSYQTVFLFLCLFWSALRTTLFSFYIINASEVNMLAFIVYWLLLGFPVCLQFTSLCLLILYFAQVILKVRVRFDPDQYRRYKWRLRLAIIILPLVFTLINLVSGILIRELASQEAKHDTLTTRVILNEGLFLLAAVWLSVCIWKITHMTSANVLLEARGTTVGQACVACVVIILLYVTRTVYNVIAVSWVQCPSFGYDWINVSDQADLIQLKGNHFLAFGVVLFVWEFLPTFILVVFFRVKRFASTVQIVPEVKSGSKTPSKAYFFDNPNRYNSDDDLSRTVSTTDMRHNSLNDIPSLLNTPQSMPQVGYGALFKSSSYSGQHHPLPGTTPPLLFSGNASLSGGHSSQIYD
ncbi:G protein-coupled receptor 137Ba-like [Lytechinus variegatus]|uniref:G protein-coupled receptor 137Ba-like n=1 Tax=Lytechinus variegatus TaxID=7654 RepID=UPI001BB0FA1C|nr:G protein-coupled receptor 137Ba-like [Lytechinus variegatus]